MVVALIEQEKLEEAIAAFRQAIAIQPVIQNTVTWLQRF
ncbi:hypothetical protein WKK05_19430 [Nostoc sp. UHCC 0302]